MEGVNGIMYVKHLLPYWFWHRCVVLNKWLLHQPAFNASNQKSYPFVYKTVYGRLFVVIVTQCWSSMKLNNDYNSWDIIKTFWSPLHNICMRRCQLIDILHLNIYTIDIKDIDIQITKNTTYVIWISVRPHWSLFWRIYIPLIMEPSGKNDGKKSWNILRKVPAVATATPTKVTRFTE